MAALVYRFSQDEYATEKLNYLKIYNEHAVSARIRFEKVKDIRGGMDKIKSFHETYTKFTSLYPLKDDLKNVGYLQTICEDSFGNDYLLCHYYCGTLIHLDIQEIKKNRELIIRLIKKCDHLKNSAVGPYTLKTLGNTKEGAQNLINKLKVTHYQKINSDKSKS